MATATLSYAALTFMAGVLVLLGWLYLTAPLSTSRKMLVRSLWLFVAPMTFVNVLPAAIVAFPLSMWALVACEEALKLFASRMEETETRRFWMVSLFGIWELILAKPLWGFTNDELLQTLAKSDLLLLVAAGMLPLAMHFITAAIYAAYFRSRAVMQFAVCWLFHIAFNEAIGVFGISLWTFVLLSGALALLFLLLWNGRLSSSTELARTG